MDEFHFLINLNPLLPVRHQPSERAEMVTQLLFGETAAVRLLNDKWVEVVNEADGYTGWVDRKMVTPLCDADHAELRLLPVCFTTEPFIRCFVKPQEVMWLPLGSRIYNWNRMSRKSYFLDREYWLRPGTPSESPVFFARTLLNAPYLWGGKSVLGVDCSGLVQLAYGTAGINLPRDAAEQANCGTLLAVHQPPMAGDLAFFENEEGKIVHVGMMVNHWQMIHASGHVRIDPLTDCGHLFHSLRRLK